MDLRRRKEETRCKYSSYLNALCRVQTKGEDMNIYNAMETMNFNTGSWLSNCSNHTKVKGRL